VVLKVIQPSLCIYPEVDGVWVGCYMNPENIEEALVYDHLVHK
jgi:hypothetical protein